MQGREVEVVEVRRFTMPGVPRGERTAARIAEEYLPFETVREGLARSPDRDRIESAGPAYRGRAVLG